MESLDKTPVVCGDKAGFIANALLFGYLNHAASMYEGRYASREDIDAAMRFGCGYPMGPLALLDLIGLDTAYEILDTMYKQGRDRLHAPAPILKQMVTAGLLGRKTGRGFYPTRASTPPRSSPDKRNPSADEAPQPSTTSPWSGSSAPGPWPAASSRSSPRPGTTWSTSASPGQGRRGPRRHRALLDKAIERGKLDESAKAAVLGRLTGSTSLDDLDHVDIVVEAIAEDLQVKTVLFENLDGAGSRARSWLPPPRACRSSRSPR